MTSKFRTDFAFINVASQTVFEIKCVCMFVTYVHIKLWTLNLNGLFVISIDRKLKRNFVIYILQKK